jgi:XTP/dITP diphosphohydrolase
VDEMRKRLVLATRNPGKVREFRRMLGDLKVDLVGLDATGVTDEVAETGSSYEDNAVLKAEGYAKLTGEMVLADDSGLEVDALDGRPGVLSARYGGPGLTDEQRVQKLLEELKDVRGWKRTARFRAVVAIAGAGVPGGVQTKEGVVEGSIAHQPIGKNGFGYDPVFWIASQAKTTAELSGDAKDALSHRGVAVRKMLPVLQQILG